MSGHFIPARAEFLTNGRSQGTSDGLVPYNEASKIMGYVPQAKLVAINGGTHFLTMEEGPQQTLVESILAYMQVEQA